tara:strand:- start:96 stop:299 length:204 start_codon:yes stop_codon:yes gene_type:complete
MSISLPNSPVRKIHSCQKCGNISVKFYNSTHDCSYTKTEWQHIITEGKGALEKILKNIKENPVFFLK